MDEGNGKKAATIIISRYETDPYNIANSFAYKCTRYMRAVEWAAHLRIYIWTQMSNIVIVNVASRVIKYIYVYCNNEHVYTQREREGRGLKLYVIYLQLVE